MKILIAEDMQVPRLVLEMTLKKLGHEYVSAVDGEQAWEAVQRDDFPVLITDWQMPKMDGLELCRRIRAMSRPRYTYIIVLTSMDAKPNYMEAIDAGTDDFMHKPMAEDLLAARLCVAERIGGQLTRLQQVQVLLPICPTCKMISDGKDQWLRMEEYVAKHCQATVTPSRCPHCQSTRDHADHNLRQGMSKLRQAFRTTP
jgi:DNA-binding response OmpR family regulator